ncbi:cupin domain-containing protein [Rhodovarius lipocyclicus]|uniref:cupin domain-containing protein n=1 Tax=Rhodovarius lipocyclicus TaxID=268410 RepID=UPI00135C7A43|nr:cupin domain-containing protein [Rhodovarius lipocyclicus]
MDRPLYTPIPEHPEGPELHGFPRGFTVIAGTPAVRNWRYYWREEAGAQTASGVWECSPGRFAFRFRHWEFFHILSGHLRLTPEGAARLLLGPGDAMAMDVGFAGEWEVLETMRKHYVTRYSEG